jgi:hypothetical protein
VQVATFKSTLQIFGGCSLYLHPHPLLHFQIAYSFFFQSLKEAFKIFDKDKSGYIDRKELRSVTTTLGFGFCV